MTEVEELLTMLLFATGMHWARVAYIVGSMPHEEAMLELVDFIVLHPDSDQDIIYSTAKEILRKYRPGRSYLHDNPNDE